MSSYFGLTVRSDEMNRFMMGQAVLKSHPLDDEFYSPDGYLGTRRTDGLTLPIGDSWTIDKFCKDFRIQRAQEPGLSVVVPYCDPEINGRVLLTAVCRDYFYPILAAKLEVTVETPTDVHLIDSETIREVAKSIARDLPKDYLDMIELAEWSTELPPKQIKRIGSTAFGFPPTWSKSLFTDDQLIDIRNSIHAGDPIAIRIPVQVREKNESCRDSYFDVFMVRRGETESGRPVFIREGIIISDVRCPRSRGVLSLVVVEDRPLAGLLGDSENPAHTQWQRNSSHFKGKYIYAPYYIPFVTRSVAEILQITVEEEEESDPSLLIDFFSLATEKPVATKAQEPKRSPKGQEPDKPEFPPPSPPRFRINRLAGGFSVKRGSEEAELPPFLRIRTAYDVRRGSALKKYDPADFSLDEMEVMAAGATIQKISGNELFVAVNDGDFQIDVSGFDEQRDLLVDVKVKEGSDDSST